MTELAAPEAAGLATRLDALSDAAALLRPYVPDEAVVGAQALVERAAERLRVGPEHTVVVLAGSTGSGKSSLFNVLVGLDLAETGVRRPTTDQTLACVCGQDDAGPLLDWLAIPRRRRVPHLSALDTAPDPLGGLVLLDLPDHDSLVLEHRAEVDRLVGLVDLFVWVVDPQKYADALLHRDYLARLSAHGAVVLVAFNQIDRLTPVEQEQCLSDLRDLVATDGLPGVAVVPVSARTGQGVDDLATRLQQVARARHAAQERLAADTVIAAGRLAASCAPTGAGTVPDLDPLVDRLATDVGLDAACADLQARQSGRARRALRWPIPSSAPPPAPTPDDGLASAASGRAAATLEEYLAEATSGLPADWARGVQDRLAPTARRLSGSWVEQADALRQESPAPPAWWSRHRRAQWASLGALAAGLALLPVTWPWATLLIALGVIGAAVLTVRVAAAPQAWGSRVADDARAAFLSGVRADATGELDVPLREEAARCDAAAAALRVSTR